MLGSLIAAFVSGEAVNAIKRAKATIVVYLVAAILAFTGIGFLIGAAYVAAAHRIGSVEASIAFGVGFLVLAVLMVVIRSIALSVQRSRSRRRAADLAAIAGAAAATALPLLLRSKAGIGGLAVPVIALVAYAIYRENSRGRTDDPGLDDQ